MKRIYLVMLAMMLSAAVHAAELELSVGHTANATNEAYSIGLTGMLLDSWRWRAGWATLGTPYLNLEATQNSMADELAAGKGNYPLHWMQPRRVKEVYVTIAPEWRISSLVYSLEVGVAAYHPQLQEDLRAREAPPPETEHRTNYTEVFGASIGYKSTAIALTYQTITGYRDWEQTTPSSSTATVWLRQRF